MNLFQHSLGMGVKGLIRLLLGVYFSRIECLNRDLVPLEGPVLFISNHPASVTDAFVLGTVLPRPVHFIATVRMFQFKPLAWLLKQVRVIPVNRMADDPKAMRSVLQTFEACHAVLEQGQAVAIFPEGVTYQDDQLKSLKTGAARIALDLESRHPGALGLFVAPVGLVYSAKDRYRSELLVHFGAPIPVGPFLSGYGDRKKECIQKLSLAMEQALKELILSWPDARCRQVTESAKRVLEASNRWTPRQGVSKAAPQSEALLLAKAMARRVERLSQEAPAEFRALDRRLRLYERLLSRLQLSNAAPGAAGGNRRSAFFRFLEITGGVALFPVAVYGAVHRFIPVRLVRWGIKRWTEADKRKAQSAHAAMLIGFAAFGFCYLLYAVAAWRIVGIKVLPWYLLSIPATGLIAQRYWSQFGRVAGLIRAAWIRFRSPFLHRRLMRMRARLIRQIESLEQREQGVDLKK